VRVSNSRVQVCKDFDNTCKLFLRFVNSSLLVRVVSPIVRFVSKYAIVDKFCNIEISFGGYMGFSVY
jgi:hypothetical protein